MSIEDVFIGLLGRRSIATSLFARIPSVGAEIIGGSPGRVNRWLKSSDVNRQHHVDCRHFLRVGFVPHRALSERADVLSKTLMFSLDRPHNIQAPVCLGPNRIVVQLSVDVTICGSDV
jgi:hypothetical protein